MQQPVHSSRRAAQKQAARRRRAAHRRIAATVVACALILGGAALAIHSFTKGDAPAAAQSGSDNAATPQPTAAATAQPTAVPEPTADPALAEQEAKKAEAVEILADWRMILVSPVSPLPDGYTVETTVCDSETGKALQNEAAEAFTQMQAAATAAGISLRLQSGYRSVEYQSGLFDRQIQKWIDTGMSEADATAKAKTIVTPPGCSEHNVGFAADINCKEYLALEEGFEGTATFAWLVENAEAYGFVLRYPKGDEDATGIIYEPWHWRYVGVENAKRINESGLCLEKYLESLQALVNA